MDPRQAELLRVIPPAELGGRLRAQRRAKGLTQGDLAGSDVSVGYVSRIEAGQRRPTPAVLESIADRLGVGVDVLLTGMGIHELDEIKILLDFSELSLESGDAQVALDQAESGLAKARSTHQHELTERAQILVGRATDALGRGNEAILLFEQVLESTQSWVTRLKLGVWLCRSYRESGDIGMAIETAERLIAQAREEGLAGSDEQVQLTVTLAAAYFERGDVNRAARACEVAVRAAEQLDSPKARASAYWNASMIQAKRGSLREAVPLAQRALALMSEGDDVRNLARLRTQFGLMQLQLDPPAVDAAKAELELAADEMAWSSATSIDKARNALAQARANLLEGSITEARDIASAVLSDDNERTPGLAAEAHSLVGQTLVAEGDSTGARVAYQAAALALTGAGADQAAAQRWYELAELMSEIGDEDAALRAYRSAGAAAGLRSYAVRGARRPATTPVSG